jgi:subtilisin-like proprotein convertase family protein
VYVSSVAPNQSASHLWRSADFGASWTQIDSGASGFPAGIPVNAVQVDPATPTTLYAATMLGVYRSTDSGSSWSRFGSGMPLVNVTKLYVSSDDSLLRAATYGRSVWELTQDTTNAAPVAAFTSSSTGLLTEFNDDSTDSDGSIASHVWTFGDGSATSTAANPVHNYRSAGTYKATLAVKDNAGSTGFVSHQVTVVAPAVTTYTASPNTVIHSGATESTIAVSGRSGYPPADAHVAVTMSYPRRGDLRIELVGPDSTVYTLKPSSTTDAQRYLSSTYTVDVSAQALNGDWMLRVTDTTAANDGFLTRWSITF